MRRNKDETCFDILMVLLYERTPIKSTNLMYKANTDHKRLNNIFLPILKEKELIRENLKGFFITTKGIDYILDIVRNEYKKMKMENK